MLLVNKDKRNVWSFMRVPPTTDLRSLWTPISTMSDKMQVQQWQQEQSLRIDSFSNLVLYFVGRTKILPKTRHHASKMMLVTQV